VKGHRTGVGVIGDLDPGAVRWLLEGVERVEWTQRRLPYVPSLLEVTAFGTSVSDWGLRLTMVITRPEVR